MVVTLLLGLPIAFSLAAAGVVGIYLLTGDWNVVLRVIGTAPFSTVADYVLTTIPMFILMAYFAAAGGLARDLYTAGAHWLSQVRGGLAIATVFACGIFGAMSGASLAAASVMSTIAMPEMRRHGYSDELAAGSIGVGSTLDILIPPSVGMVIYGIMTQTSIGKLLIAGIVPGLIVGAFLDPRHRGLGPGQPVACAGDLRRPHRGALEEPARIWASLLLIVLVVALLYLGVATPTEVGALGAFLSGVIGVATGRLTLAGALDAIRQTIKTSAMIFMILIGATIFGYYMAMSQIPQHVVAAVTELNLNRWVVICGIVVAYFVVSMFMDELPLLLLTLQLTFPLIVSMGFDPGVVRGALDADGVHGARVPPGGHDRLRGERHRGGEPREGLQGHEHPDDRARADDRPDHGLPADRALAAEHDAVSEGRAQPGGAGALACSVQHSPQAPPRPPGCARPSAGGSAAGGALGVHVEVVERCARRHEQAVAVGPAEAEIGAALGQVDPPDELAVGVEDMDSVEPFLAHAPAAPEIAVHVAAEAVGRAGPGVDEACASW